MRRLAPVMVLLWLGPLAVGWFVLGRAVDVDPRFATASPPPTAVVGRRHESGRQPAIVTLEWGDPHVATLVTGDGVVTASILPPGATFRTGAAVVRIDAAIRLAYVGPQPFYRDLRQGDAGWDVQQLDAFLVELGVASAPTLDERGRFGPATRRAVEALQRFIGDTDDGVFRASSVIYSSQEFEVDSVSVDVGVSVTSGSEIVRGPMTLVGARVEPIGDPLRRRVVSGRALRVELAESVEVVVPDTWFESVGDELRSLIPRAAEGEAELSVTIELAEPLDVGVVPATALMSSVTTPDSQCLVVWQNGVGMPVAVPTELVSVGEDPGLASIPVTYVGVEVLALPDPRVYTCPARSSS